MHVGPASKLVSLSPLARSRSPWLAVAWPFRVTGQGQFLAESSRSALQIFSHLNDRFWPLAALRVARFPAI